MSVNNQNNIIENQDEHDFDLDLSQLLKYLLSKWTKIILGTLLGLIIGLGYSKFLATPKYEASAKIYIVNTNDESQVNLSDLQVGSNLVNDYISLMKNRTLLDSVITNLDLPYNYDEFNEMISVSNPTNTRELKLSAVSKDPEEAQKIANELATQSIEYLPSITGAKAPSLVEKAVFPDSPVSPKTGRNTILGGFIGFVLTSCFYILKFVQNDSFRTSDDIQKAYGVMPLASIPEDIQNSNTKKKRKK